MKQEMSKKQKWWLQLIASLGVLVACAELLLMPGVARLRQALEQRDQARKTQQDMNIAVMTVAAVAQDIEENQKKRTELARRYYDLSAPQKLEQELTQLAAEHGLQVHSIQIKGAEPGLVAEYLPGLSAEQQQEWSQNREEAGQVWPELLEEQAQSERQRGDRSGQEAGQVWPELQEEQAQSAPPQEEPPQQAFVYTQRLDLAAVGSKQAWVDFLDAVAGRPALHLTDLQRQPGQSLSGEDTDLPMEMVCRFQVLLTPGQQAP